MDPMHAHLEGGEKAFERTALVERAFGHKTGFQLDRALEDARRCHRLGRHRGQTCGFELVLFIAEAAREFVCRDVFGAGGLCQLVDRGDLVNGRHVDYHLAGPAQVFDRLRVGLQAKDAAPAHEDGRGHRRKVRRAILVQRAEQSDGRAEIEDVEFADDVHRRVLRLVGFPVLAFAPRRRSPVLALKSIYPLPLGRRPDFDLEARDGVPASAGRPTVPPTKQGA